MKPNLGFSEVFEVKWDCDEGEMPSGFTIEFSLIVVGVCEVECFK